MKVLQKGIWTFIFVLLASTVFAQVTKLRFNEVMVNNRSSYIDHYGQHMPWFEIYNTYGATVNIAGCYLTNDRNEPLKYKIPKGDLSTKIGPRQFVIFWADNNSNNGTFHLNFTLDPSKDNYLALHDNSGKLIDEITIPAAASAMVDRSFGRMTDGLTDDILPTATPKTGNFPQSDNSASQKFKAQDPTGFGMSLTAMSVVFMALLMLYIIFKNIAKVYIGMTARKFQHTAEQNGTPVPSITELNSEGISGEVCAAIALALNLHEGDLHDNEETVLTIAETKRRYSPWSSKIYTLRQIPQVKPANRQTK